MEFDPDKARKLCSAAEFQLFTESRDNNILEFTAEGLKKRAYQAQKLFELWNGRVSAEQDAGWGKVGEARKKAATGYITARQKSELFEDIWKRFDARLKAVLKNPDLPVKDKIKKGKATGKLNKGTDKLDKDTATIDKPKGQLLNKPGNRGDDPNRVWI
jgi:hypothetical protein